MSSLEAQAAHAHACTACVVQGVGIGLRAQHIAHVLTTRPDVPWFEILADNHIAPGGLIPAQLEAVRELYPLTFHCVGMSLGGTDPLDYDYLSALKHALDLYQPAWISDHLCFTSHDQRNYYDLLPLPFNETMLRHLADRIAEVQDFLGCRIAVENVSSYLGYRVSDLEEAEFLAQLLELADCDLLLDVNNVYVNSVNFGLSAERYLDAMPLDRIKEIHLAGYEDKGDYLLDAHNSRVTEPVWALYERIMRRQPTIPALIEWDNDIPDFAVLQEEAQHARVIAQAISSQQNQLAYPL